MFVFCGTLPEDQDENCAGAVMVCVSINSYVNQELLLQLEHLFLSLLSLLFRSLSPRERLLKESR